MTVSMELASWKQLPSDLQVFTLAKLPLRQLVSSRCVSKEWLSFATDENTLAFSRSSITPLMAEPMLAMGYDGKESLEWATYNCESNQWSIMPPFPDIVLEAASSGEKIDYCSAGGLLFFMLSSYHNYTETKCLVYNPLTKRSRELPVFRREWVVGAFSHPIVDTQADTYKFVMGDQEHWACYSSTSGVWDEGSIDAVGCLASANRGVQCKNLLFFVAPTMRGKSDLATYNPEKNVWLTTFDYERAVEVGYHLNNRGYSENNRIFEWDESLFLLTTLDGRFCELDLVTKDWNLRFEMPRRLLGEFEKIQNCIASGNRLFVVGSAKSPRYTSLILLYLKDQNSWRKLKPCPLTSSLSFYRNTLTDPFFANTGALILICILVHALCELVDFVSYDALQSHATELRAGIKTLALDVQRLNAEVMI